MAKSATRKSAASKSGGANSSDTTSNDTTSSAQNAGPGAGQDEGGERRSKQAVVVIHGIGEQRPLETLRSFVETVYQRDLSLTEDHPGHRVNDPALGLGHRVCLGPDQATGSVELRRITTPTNRAGVGTDFFEFYWADIMQGTPAELVTAWSGM